MNHPSQPCQHCNASGVAHSLLGDQIPCPTCEGWGKVTIKAARRYEWRVVHRKRMDIPKNDSDVWKESAMKPYYEEAGITIYHGDCREVLPFLDISDAVVTDPPYNAGKDYGGHNDSMGDLEYTEFCREVVDLCQCAAKNQFWVASRYKLPVCLELLKGSHLVVIPRGASGPFRQGWSDQFEIALAIGKPSVCVPDLWEGIRLKGEGYFFREETFGHPGYTPYPIMDKAVHLLAEISVMEPFCGTGTTLAAAKRQGKTAIGIELNESY